MVLLDNSGYHCTFISASTCHTSPSFLHFSLNLVPQNSAPNKFGQQKKIWTSNTFCVQRYVPHEDLFFACLAPLLLACSGALVVFSTATSVNAFSCWSPVHYIPLLPLHRVHPQTNGHTFSPADGRTSPVQPLNMQFGVSLLSIFPPLS